MSELEPDDRFDREWPHALRQEVGRIPLPRRRPVGRYAVPRFRRSRRQPGSSPRTATAVAVLVAVASIATFVIGGGRVFFQPRSHVPAGSAAREQQNNEALHPATTAPVAPSLAPIVTAPVGNFTYRWTGGASAPEPWVPGGVNDWDLLATTGFPSDQGGTMQARFGPDCAPPPATHPVRALADSAYLCHNQLLTAINGGGDSPKTYAGVFFAPAQLADFGGGTSTITWQVSTQRTSTNDWWDVWLTPFDENLAAPVAPSEAPAFNGPPRDAVHIRMNNGTCPGSGQAPLGTANGVPIGTVFNVEVFSGGRPSRIDGPGFQPCLETAAGRDGTAGFRLDVSQTHVELSVPRTGRTALVYADAAVKLPFKQAVVQFAHHSLDPRQACGGSGTCGPNTYQWSNVSIDPAAPFTMLRPSGAASVHGGAVTLALPRAAPAGAHLRFYGIGSIRVAFDGRPAAAAAAQQGQQPGTGEASYWMPVPEGATRVTLSGSGTGGLPWWVFDVSVWALVT
ncbi:MAG TPA: hypothetical protein VOB72_20115 [Candidatus Dormibacteraeota bacterium]|nr:hypothetical protein [Candidatus Dormibacteraeota bacterium]